MLALASASASDDYRPPRRQQPIRPRQDEDEREGVDYGFAAPVAFTATTEFVQPNYDRIVFSSASTSKGSVAAEWRRNTLLAHLLSVPTMHLALPPSSIMSATQWQRLDKTELAAIWRELYRKLAGDEARDGILERLRAIHEAATDEGVEIVQASETQFRRYLLQHLKPTVRPAISLSESGYLTAAWRDANGQQVGMQFRGDGWVHYFVFARTPEGALRSYAGRLELPEFLPLLKLVGVTNLIYR